MASSKVSSVRLVCSLTSMVTKAEGSHDDSSLTLTIEPSNVSVQALEEALSAVETSYVYSSHKRANRYELEEAAIGWMPGQRLRMIWGDANMEPWPLIDQVMKQLLIQSIRVKILEMKEKEK